MTREEKFNILCKDLYNVLTDLNTNYPKAIVPMLVVTPTEKLDVLDYIVNENYIEECKIND
jgi:hypothetical protein